MGEGLEGVPMSMERMLEIPVSIVPTEAIRAMRIIGESRGWEMSRFQDSTLVHRWAIIVPIAKRARVLGLKVTDGEAKDWRSDLGATSPVIWKAVVRDLQNSREFDEGWKEF